MVRLVCYEWKKAFSQKIIWLVCISFLILNFFKIQGDYQEKSYLAGEEGKIWNEAFHQIYSEYEGTITTEKIQKLLDMYRPLETQVLEMTANTEQNNPSTMTGNVYGDYNLLKRYFVTPMEYFYQYHESAGSVASQAKVNSIYYSTKENHYEEKKNAVIYHLFENRKIFEFQYMEMQEHLVNYEFSYILVLLLVLYAVLGVFGVEREAKMDQLLLTNLNGRWKTLLAKLSASMIFIFLVTLLFSIADVISFCVAFHIIY